MVKAYLRYEFSAAFGVITSAANPAYDASGKLLFTSSLESISVWNAKQGSLVRQLSPVVASTSGGGGGASGSVSEVTTLCCAPGGTALAAGYSDGTAFLPGQSKLVSCSKDGLLKVWDLDTQHCCQTLGGHKAEVWSLDVNPAGTRLATGATDNEVRVFAIRDPEAIAEPAAAADGAPAPRDHSVLLPMGSVRRGAASHERVALLRYDGEGGWLGVQGAGRGLELFRVRDEDEARRKLKRRRKRRAEKATKKGKSGAGGSDDEGEGAGAAAAGDDDDTLKAELERLQALEEEIMSTTGPEDERLEAIYERIDELDPATFESRAAELLHGLGFSPAFQQRLTKDLSGGWRMRVALARALFAAPTLLCMKNNNLLLLDEPTNHLDIEAIDSLADAIKRYDGGMVLVSHDFRLIDQVAKEIWVCEKQTVTVWKGDIRDYKALLAKKMGLSGVPGKK
ncbi:hypothetical protein GPECTOR_38g260 [Gonium pectorale]|uniref:ABC transporter domain-containing protein n=1 Tax=Gonium pectorale TaxID=33097 RepID=A0A150GB73_GONPE|nr:hypothetical protein GPECTOR_38g260 [Gonium pectorale]|eukprot:KXZ47023.1 hypothetical protein GPECTOR_38g260 [Gonium pectorale]